MVVVQDAVEVAADPAKVIVQEIVMMAAIKHAFDFVYIIKCKSNVEQ